MGLHFDIPPELAHLKTDPRGYPIPFFVPYIDGKPNFRYVDEGKQIECIKRRVCGICGKKLYKDYQYFIAGPLGLKNRVSSDPPMHRVCAEFSLKACPHMYFQAAQRKAEDNAAQDWYLVTDKPGILFMVKAHQVRVIPEPVNHKHIFHFNPVLVWKYIYSNGVLEFSQEQPYTPPPKKNL